LIIYRSIKNLKKNGNESAAARNIKITILEKQEYERKFLLIFYQQKNINVADDTEKIFHI
jgi:hypothetical protein